MDVVNFLAELFHQGYQYHSLNAYRFAISSIHAKVDGEQVGQHLLVSWVLKGAFDERPLRPKYQFTWDINLVVDMFRSEGDPSSLSLQKLTFRTVMLFALTRPCRGADLVDLDLNNRVFCPEGVVFNPTQLSKQLRPSHFNVVFFPSFQDDKRLCPMEALKQYEVRTSRFCTDKVGNRLFHFFIGEHKPVCSSTIAKWLKTYLQKAGIDVIVFQAHCTWAALRLPYQVLQLRK